MKQRLFFIFLLAVLATTQLGAQGFNLRKLKKTNSPAVTDSAAIKAGNGSPAAATNNTDPIPAPAAPTVTLSAEEMAKIKPKKNIDTSAMDGGFNANAKKSLRNNYAFFTAEPGGKRSVVRERKPLDYQNIREDDALFSEFVWEEIDGREKLNRPFTYKAYDDSGDQRFFAILLKAIEKDGVVPFSAEGNDDRFTNPISIDEINAKLKGKLDTMYTPNLENPNINDTIVYYNTKYAFKADSIYTFRLKEQYIFDNKTSRMYCRIIGVAPVATTLVNNKPEKVTLFWIYYPDLRASLAKSEVYNPKNYSTRITWEELLESRYFNSYITKSTLDNYNNESLKSLYADPVRRLQEGEKIRQKIFTFEQDRWVY